VRSFKAAITCALVMASMLALSASALAERIPTPGTPGQPLASGNISGSNLHGVIHCQAAVDLLIDPTAPPGSAPGGIVVTPNGFVLGAPQDGECAELYTLYTGQQP
jgi:hypothetical protein